ncbi:hypothetical protein PIB30_006582 [Stylosanthes scabra]|uniref:Uncharacterized protein n=1 Tax=Stylosanthes scabra TaxID=79078 RepID=A0ABU6Y2P1_9FABA|nr:hypothetical protein [Stylosanthes scabra]
MRSAEPDGGATAARSPIEVAAASNTRSSCVAKSLAKKKQKGLTCDAEKLPRPHHAPAWLRRGTYPNGAMTAPQPHLGVGFHHSPRLSVAKEAQTMPEPSYSVVRALNSLQDRAIPMSRRGSSMKTSP